MSKMRSKIPSDKSKKSFTRHAKKTLKKNVQRVPMRGGIRL